MKNPARMGNTAGFTLIEVMMIILVISILVGIATVGQADNVRKSKEKATIADLNAIRKTLGLYASDHDGAYPAVLTDLTTSRKYLSKIPPADLPPNHDASTAVLAAAAADDAGGWLYSAVSGVVTVNCTHTDTKGAVWTSY